MVANKTYDKIIRNITSGLTGDFEKDKVCSQYLVNQPVLSRSMCGT